MNDIEDSDICLGLINKTQEIVSAISFKKDNEKWIIKNHAYNIHYINNTMYDMIFDFFKDKYQPQTVIGYLDRRWASLENEPFFNETGFYIDDYLEPRFFYVNSHRIRLTEEIYNTLEDKSDFFKITDCGLIKYVWKR